MKKALLWIVLTLSEQVKVPRVTSAEGNIAEGEELPQGDSEGPDVGLDGEAVLGQALGRGPLDGELGLLVGVLRADAGEAEVADLGHQVRVEHDVARGQVAVDDALAAQLNHARGNLEKSKPGIRLEINEKSGEATCKSLTENCDEAKNAPF